MGLRFALAAGIAATLWGQAASALTLGMNWTAQAELGGFYQAQAAGLYSAAGLDVKLVDGGPEIDNARALEGGRLDMAVLSDPYAVMRTVLDHSDVVTVAAFFQRNPQILLAHPGSGVDGLASLRGRSIHLSVEARETWWPWLKKVHGFTDNQFVGQSYSLRRFLETPDAIQQGYLTDEPFQAATMGMTPVVLLLADYGFPPYSTLLGVRRSVIERDPDAVRRLVRATAQGWRDYLFGDRTAADRIILKSGRDMTQARIDYAVKMLVEKGIVLSGDAADRGIGTMTQAAWDAFVGQAMELGLYPAQLDWRSAIRFEFSETGVRMP
jgi:NitT/TauT family transport system substrate-binding protein